VLAVLLELSGGANVEDASRAVFEAARDHVQPRVVHHTPAERESFIDDLLVRIHLIIEMILVDRPCAMGVLIPFSR